MIVRPHRRWLSLAAAFALTRAAGNAGAQPAPLAERDAAIRQAERTFGAMRDRARAEGSIIGTARAELGLAETLRSLGTAEPRDDKLMVKTAAAYKTAADLGDPQTKIEAQNGLGLLWLDLGRAREAATVFDEIDLESAPAESRAVYQYNAARAVEQSGQQAQALARYRRLIGAHPDFRPASVRAFAILAKLPPDPKTAGDLADQLNAAKQSATVVEGAHALLEGWGTKPEAEAAVVLLVHGYVASRMTPSLYRELEQPRLAATQTTAVGRKLLADVEAVLLGTLPIPAAGAPPFPAWREPARAPAFGQLLMAVAGDLRVEQPEQALARYASAILLDPRNSPAALQTAALLADRPALMEAHQNLLEPWLASMFSAKGDAYDRGDLEDILRLHMVLGDYFLTVGTLGPESNPRSAIYQYRNAEAADERRVPAPTARAPGIPLKLAEAYEKAGRPEDACGASIRGAQRLLGVARPSRARAALGRCQRLYPRLSQLPPDLRRELEATAKEAELSLPADEAAAPALSQLALSRVRVRLQAGYAYCGCDPAAVGVGGELLLPSPWASGLSFSVGLRGILASKRVYALSAGAQYDRQLTPRFPLYLSMRLAAGPAQARMNGASSTQAFLSPELGLTWALGRHLFVDVASSVPLFFAGREGPNAAFQLQGGLGVSF